MERKRKTMRAIIAHPIPEEQARIASILKKTGIFQVRYMTHDGLDCLREVISTQPDLLILDAVLDKIDGLEVLRRLKEFPLIRTKCLMLTSYSSYIKDYALCLGADYCLMAPYADGVLAEAARMQVLPPEASFDDREIDAESARILRNIGVPTRLKAYPFVQAAVRILIRDPDLVRRRCVVKGLYGSIAQYFKVPDSRVERAMRTLTNRVFDKGDREYLAQYFTSSDMQQAHATNTDFLVTLTHLVKEALKTNAAERNNAQSR